MQSFLESKNFLTLSFAWLEGDIKARSKQQIAGITIIQMFTQCVQQSIAEMTQEYMLQVYQLDTTVSLVPAECHVRSGLQCGHSALLPCTQRC